MTGRLTTPPIPSSSPGPQSDSMDISPLPHKAPTGSTYEINLQSPTPELTPADSSLLTISSPPIDIALPELPTLTLPTERRKSGPLRPALSRMKGLSTGSIPQKANLESQLPPFRFGSGLSKPATSSTLSLSEAFAESPPQEKTVLMGGPVLGAARQKLSFGVGFGSRNGSPGHIRKTSNPLVRPRKQFRRSLSMFEHPEDVVNQEKPTMMASTLPTIMDIEAPQVPQLPHFLTDDVGSLPRITKETMVDVLDGKFNTQYDKLLVIDCRFEYEYQGGHIDGAVNFNDKDRLGAQLFDLEPTSKALLIFHCEYSAHRAPIMAKFIRNKDRTINVERYPNLTYPETYILDGGYSSFFKDHSLRCYPQNYVEMDAAEHTQACERGLGKVRQRSKLIRAQTFAFGQASSPTVDSSPTGYCNRRPNDDVDMDCSQLVPTLSTFYPSRFAARRMESY